MDRKPLLLVGVGKMGLGYLTAANRLGIPVRVVEFPSFVDRSRALADAVTGVESMLDESWYAGALRVLDGATPRGVIGFSEPQVLPAALLQDAYGLPGPGLHAATVSRDKALQRALFGRHRIPQPEYLLTARLPDATAWAADRFPVVVKPLAASGSQGVELVRDAAGFDEAARRRADEGPLLVERAVDGPEFSVECLVRDGSILFTNITAKETTGPPYFVEVSHRPGHRLASAAERLAVDGLTSSVLAALRMRTGIVHLEYRQSTAGPVVMEVAVRTPGDFIMDATSLTWGFDLFEALVRLATGDVPAVPAAGTPVRAAASRFLFADPGRVTAIAGYDEVSAHPAVVRCVLNHAVGDEVPQARSSLHRSGHVLVDAADADEREDVLSLVGARLRLHTEPIVG